MTFTVTYRDKTGARREECVEAISRDAAFAAMKARGIAPIGLEVLNGDKGFKGDKGFRTDESDREINGPKALNGLKRPKDARNRTSPLLRNLAILVAFALLCGGAWWWFGGGHAGRVPLPREGRAARSAPPQSQTNSVRVASHVVPAMTNAATKAAAKPKAKTYRDERGVERYMNGTRVFDPSRRRKEPVKVAERPLFRNWAENQIATVLTLEPGTMLFGTRRFDARFLELFKKSLGETIEILDTDTDEQKRVKEAVIEAKKELKAAMDRGEDVCEIMREAFDELTRLASYKREIKKQLREIAADADTTSEDFDTLLKEANKMLTEKGIAPLNGNMIVRRNMKLAAQKGTKQTTEQGQTSTKQKLQENPR